MLQSFIYLYLFSGIIWKLFRILFSSFGGDKFKCEKRFLNETLCSFLEQDFKLKF
jgi:hypothetical protein